MVVQPKSRQTTAEYNEILIGSVNDRLDQIGETIQKVNEDINRKLHQMSDKWDAQSALKSARLNLEAAERSITQITDQDTIAKFSKVQCAYRQASLAYTFTKF